MLPAYPPIAPAKLAALEITRGIAGEEDEADLRAESPATSARCCLGHEPLQRFGAKRHIRIGQTKWAPPVMTVPTSSLVLPGSLCPGRVFLVDVYVQLAKGFLRFLCVELAIACQA